MSEFGAMCTLRTEYAPVMKLEHTMDFGAAPHIPSHSHTNRSYGSLENTMLSARIFRNMNYDWIR